MARRDFYEVLGVKHDASADDIRKAYRSLARKLHPDVNADEGAEAQFKDVSEAYQILSDPEKRRVYDAYGFEGLAGAGANGFGDFGFGGFGDLFDMFFGGGGGGGRRTSRRQGPARGSDLRYDMEISFFDAVFGTEVEIEIPAIVDCEKCDGSGSATKASPVTCDRCGGTGEVRHAQRTPFGQLVNVVTCPHCHGAGRVAQDPCRECRGVGKVRSARKVEVKVPGGVDTGQRLRLMGEGEPGDIGGQRGDLYVFINVAEHEFFKRDGQNIHCEIPISFVQAALGADVLVPTLDNHEKKTSFEKLKIPAGTQTGATFRLREKGVPSLRGGRRGDQYVTVRVLVPKDMSSKQKKILEEFAQEAGEEVRAPQKSFFGRIKDMMKG